MKIKLLLTLCCVVFLSDDVFAQGEIKRGTFPFMAFIYYSDDTVVDSMGRRFLRGGVLIRPSWLVTSAVQIGNDDADTGFSRKTLLARVGAISIDKNFQLNEDEDEQENEIIQILRPYNQSATQWWRTDISLMKTLRPFNLTSAVALATLHTKKEPAGKMCSILVYTNKRNWTEENRSLVQLSVELLPPSMMNCGNHFYESTMTCAADIEESKRAAYFSNFCQGNNGGPLICDGEVMALQTYINNNCHAPHLYQLLSAWENFITCGTEDKCQEEQCANICLIANKDPPMTTEPQRTNATLSFSTDRTQWTQEDGIPTVLAELSVNVVSELLTRSPEITKPATIPTTEASTTSPAMETIIVDIPKKTTGIMDNMQTIETTTTERTISKITRTGPKITTTIEEIQYDKYGDELETRRKLNKEDKEDERKANVEAQYAIEKKKPYRSAAERNIFFQSLFNICILASFI